MKWQATMQRMALTVALFGVVALSVAAVKDAAFKKAPGVVDLDRVSFEIVSARFVDRLDASNAQFKETEPEKYRGLLMTVRVQKPADHVLWLRAHDVVIHYRYGEKDFDVAPAVGLSSFSVSNDLDRPMVLKASGYITMESGNATTASDVLYFDAFFQNMEPTTSDIYLAIAQPVAQYRADGWTQ